MRVKNAIYVIHSNSKIESLFTLFPLIVSRYSHLVNFVNINSRKAIMCEGNCAILVRTFKGNSTFSEEDEKKRAYVKDFRKRFNRVVILDDGAGSDSLHYEYMDLVDLYYKGKVIKDRSHYLKPMYGRQIFTNYYNEKYGIVDDKNKMRNSPSDKAVLEKLRVSWNLGYGLYPMPGKNLIRVARGATHLSLSKVLRPWFLYAYKKMLAKASQPINYNSKVPKVHARFGYKSLPNTIGYQRKIFTEKCLHNRNVITGNIKSGAYNKEVKEIGAVLSPYGWGEVCFRDFEAVINGALLIKPDMDHIETWPNIYQRNHTYIPIDWDGNNLMSTIDRVSAHMKDYFSVAEKAKDVYKNSLLDIDNKVLTFLEEAAGKKMNITN